MQSRTSGLAAGALSVLALAAVPSGAFAAPVTVDLRIEGKSRTLYEGPVSTDVRTFRFATDAAEYQCDGTAPAGASAAPVPTRGAAITAASLGAPFSTGGTFNQQFQSPIFSEIAGDPVGFDAGTNEFLAEYKNGSFAQAGACGDPVADGDRVLFAYATGSEPLLALTGPAAARPGETVTVRVTDAGTGTPVVGATVGPQQTAADGTAQVVAAQRGDNEFKATKPGTIRSNRLRVCATDGQDGSCGTTRPGQPPVAAPLPPPARDTVRPVGRVTGLRTGQRFSRRSAPRQLRITAGDPSGVAQVKLRLTRRLGGRCAYLSGRKDAFVKSRCGRSFAFTASDAGDFSYLLPERLTAGRYVLDVVAVDRAGNRDVLVRGRSRIVFTVR